MDEQDDQPSTGHIPGIVIIEVLLSILSSC